MPATPATVSLLYEPRGAAAAVLRCKEPEVLISGPAGTGKSVACLWKLHYCCNEVPGVRALILRKTRASLTDSALVTFERDVLPEGHSARGGPNRENRHAYHYPNGSEIVTGGLEPNRVRSVMSTDYDLIYVQEAVELQEPEWEAVSTRLRNGRLPFQQLLADTNPDSPRHWLKRRCDRGQTLLIESRHEDNPSLWDGGAWTPHGVEYMVRLDALTGPRKPRLRYGRWVQAEGVVYDGWDPAVHLVYPFPIPAGWPRFRSIDFGFTNPFVCLWGALDPDGRLYVYRELYMTGRTVRAHAADIKRRGEGEHFEATVADSAAAEDRATLMECGIGTLPSDKPISLGIQAVETRLAKAPDGRPRLFLVRGCLVERDESLAAAHKPVCCQDEFDSYVWPKAADGKPIKEVPVDLNNHALDALRYLVMHLDARERVGGATMESGGRSRASLPPRGERAAGDIRRPPRGV